jgi:thiol-disulfide isomerase/thioredoxin
MRKIATAILLLSMTLPLSACFNSGDGMTSGDGQGYVSAGGSATVIDAADRKTAPDISGTTLDGKDLSLSDFAGDVVVLNVWGSWCGDCREEAQALQAVYADNRTHGVQFIGLNTRDHDAEARAYEQSFGVGYPSLIDESGELQLAFHESLPFDSIPSTLVIDRDGRVAARILGSTSYTQLSGIVDQISSES